MSNAQKEAITKFWNATQQWITRGVLAANIWFLSEVYHDLKTEFRKVKEDVQTLKENDREQFTAIEFLKDQIKSKR